MKYIRNLITALAGSNPYQMELDRVREEYEKTAERVRELGDIYYKLREQLTETNKQVAGYQTLIENLRKRLSEKDTLMEQAREDSRKQAEEYRKRISDYSATIARLQKELSSKTPERKPAGRKNMIRKTSKTSKK